MRWTTVVGLAGGALLLAGGVARASADDDACAHVRASKRLADKHDLDDSTLSALERRYCGTARRKPSRTERPRQRRGKTLIAYRSDSCSGDAQAFINESTVCESLPDVRTWGLRVGERCIDVTDQPLPQLCETHGALAGRQPVEVYWSDSCSGSMEASFGPRTSCEQLPDQRKAWALKVDGRCIDIQDTDIQSACRNFGGM